MERTTLEKFSRRDIVRRLALGALILPALSLLPNAVEHAAAREATAAGWSKPTQKPKAT
jgi:hypothetical protein